MPDALPSDVQAVKDRADTVYPVLCDWVETYFGDCDKRALAVAFLKLGVNLHIEVLGQKAAMKLLRSMFRHV